MMITAPAATNGERTKIASNPRARFEERSRLASSGSAYTTTGTGRGGAARGSFNVRS
jgi:hypothetical protein